MKIWHNGVLVEWENARIDPADRGLTLGDGLFETIAVRRGTILRLEKHLARLAESCRVLDIACPPVDFPGALAELMKANGIGEGLLRILVSRGPAPRGRVPPKEIAKPTVLLTSYPMPPCSPASAIIATVTRRNAHSPLSRVKTLNYLDNILAEQEATARGADQAILLNTEGFVAEAMGANIFIVKGDRLLTPPVADGALPGTMRAAIMEAHAVREESQKPEDLLKADGVFLSSCIGIRAVTSIDGAPLPVAEELIAELNATLGA